MSADRKAKIVIIGGGPAGLAAAAAAVTNGTEAGDILISNGTMCWAAF
jgi:thioredoxin reductase